MMCIWKILLLKGGCGSVIIDFLPLPHCYGHWHLFFKFIVSYKTTLVKTIFSAWKVKNISNVWPNSVIREGGAPRQEFLLQCQVWSMESEVFTVGVAVVTETGWKYYPSHHLLTLLQFPLSPGHSHHFSEESEVRVRVTTAQTNWISSPPTYKLCWPGATI